jgi:peptide-methionine (R)-S-oxide reductase
LPFRAACVEVIAMQRRTFVRLTLKSIAGAALLSCVKGGISSAIAAAKAPSAFQPLALSNAQWKEKLTPAQYDILRNEGTERAFTSPLLNEHREGMFACAGCDLPLFPSRFKYDSGTGWPSFYDSIHGHLALKKDYALMLPRTEYHCARCGGHHGHVFDDGPKPTGLRYCSNGVALTFTPTE